MHALSARMLFLFRTARDTAHTAFHKQNPDFRLIREISLMLLHFLQQQPCCPGT